MDLDDQLSLGPLFLTDRKCRTCGVVKNLIDGFYKKGPGMNPSSYSTECKVCAVKRVLRRRRDKIKSPDNYYPDW